MYNFVTWSDWSMALSIHWEKKAIELNQYAIELVTY